MIICSNCGATNNEAKGHICRKCGALLPVSTKTPRVKIQTKKKPIKKVKQTSSKPQGKKKQVKSKKQSKSLELQEIPKVNALPSIKVEEEENIIETESNEQYDDFTEEEDEEEVEREFLTEITPGPFKGSIIAQKNVYGSFNVMEKRKVKPSTPKTSTKTTKPKEVVTSSDSLIRQKQLEQDMSKVLKILSDKITIEQLPSHKSEKKGEVKKEKESIPPPASMNEILRNLLKLDINIEASAIIKSEGTILASAISSRISDTLFGVIGQNLSMIGKDIIEGLNAGKLLNISIRGSEGVLDLAPISHSQDMLLILFSNPRIKSGIIYFAAGIVKKQVKQYLGLND
ncbi:MAG: roadblock/LC7 domain-containing protein [Promethearchaeota archaeon]